MYIPFHFKQKVEGKILEEYKIIEDFNEKSENLQNKIEL